MILKLEA